MWGLEHIWWVPILPMIGAIANGVFGFLWPRSVTNLFAIGSTGLSFLVAVVAFFNLISLPEGERLYESVLFTWIQAGPFTAEAGIQIDPLSATWLLIVTGIGFLIHVYSTGYMSHEEAYPRFFSYLNLFMFSMLLLVLGNNFLLMFIGWEGVGLCSYLLIGYYYEKKSASDAGKKAFVMNRIGDFAFLIAIMWIFWDTGSIDYTTVFGMAHDTWAAGGMAITAITLLLFIGATGKSAQIPLYTWLPDAMEGPTPVSALIHAATMVTAGIYMVARSATLFNMAPTTMMTVAAIGAITAIFAATMGMYQYDIKRVLAYSTVSQLGYMFLALGVGAYVAAAFHVMTHAFFKACLFLGSGSVIHGMSGEQDMRQMGGLKKLMPQTHATFLIATIAIAGIPPLAGFFSKDEILLQAFLGHEMAHKVFWGYGYPSGDDHRVLYVPPLLHDLPRRVAGRRSSCAGPCSRIPPRHGRAVGHLGRSGSRRRVPWPPGRDLRRTRQRLAHLPFRSPRPDRRPRRACGSSVDGSRSRADGHLGGGRRRRYPDRLVLLRRPPGESRSPFEKRGSDLVCPLCP